MEYFRSLWVVVGSGLHEKFNNFIDLLSAENGIYGGLAKFRMPEPWGYYCGTADIVTVGSSCQLFEYAKMYGINLQKSFASCLSINSSRYIGALFYITFLNASRSLGPGKAVIN